MTSIQKFYMASFIGDHLVTENQELQSRCIDLAHEGHQGICKTKKLLRDRVWFPLIDKLVEQACESCSICALNKKAKPAPLKMSNMPDKPLIFMVLSGWK